MSQESYAISWNESEIVSEYEKENPGEDGQWVLADAFECTCDEVSQALDKLNPEKKTLHCRVENFGWRGTSGEAFLEFKKIGNSGWELLSAILPKTPCTWTMDVYPDKLVIDNAHHDKPTGGEIYTIEVAHDKED